MTIGARGRGLRIGHPDLIPLERVDIIEDLKRLVDVHRLTDFSLHDRVVPTIELRRTEDELILAAAVFLGQLAANFSHIQLWNGTTDKVLRPVSIVLMNQQGNEVDLLFTGVQTGVAQVGQVLDRRKSSGPFAINAGTVGQLSSFTAVAQAGSAFWASLQALNTSQVVPEALLRTMALPPGTGLNAAGGLVNQGVLMAIAYRVDFLASTRPAGV